MNECHSSILLIGFTMWRCLYGYMDLIMSKIGEVWAPSSRKRHSPKLIGLARN